MTRFRLLYLALAGIALLFSILYLPVLSVYLLVTMLLLPIVLFCTVQVAGAQIQTELSLPPKTVSPHTPFPCSLLLRSRSRLPLGTAKLTIQWIHICSGETATISQSVLVPSNGIVRLTCTLQSGHCGAVQVEVSRIQVYDVLHLFSKRCTHPLAQTVCVLPVIPTPPPIHFLPTTISEQASFSSEADPTEWSEIQPYREGDPIRRIHWKLSSRSPELMVRISEAAVPAPFLVCFLYSLTPEAEAPESRLDTMLEALFALTAAICSTGVVLTVVVSDGIQLQQATLASAAKLPELLAKQLKEMPGNSAEDCLSAIPMALWESASFCITDQAVPIPENCIGFSASPSLELPRYHTILPKYSSKTVYEALGASN